MIIRKGIARAVGKNTARFFMPGHNGDKYLPLKYDVTEIKGTDNLQNPSGIIKAAQEKAAAVFGALATFFLVNGSSVGLHALIMSVCKRGDTLIVDRSCHISVINALVLNDIRPVYIYPEYNSEYGIFTHINPADIEAALAGHPGAKGVLITSPNYYGICSDIKKIADIAHAFGAALIVDEAHGAHFSVCGTLPPPALACGADGVVQSAHKTLPCITQGALLHIGSGRINQQEVRENLNMLHTTSPSYLIMMSIDDAVDKISKLKDAEKTIKRCIRLKNAVSATGKYKCLDNSDTTRIVINAGENADRINSALERGYDIRAEMCDGRNLIFIAKLFGKASDLDRLEKALLCEAGKLPMLKKTSYPAPSKTRLALPPALAYYSDTKTVSPKDAIGKIAARAVFKIPPCISLIAPGEVITKQLADEIKENICIMT